MDGTYSIRNRPCIETVKIRPASCTHINQGSSRIIGDLPPPPPSTAKVKYLLYSLGCLLASLKPLFPRRFAIAPILAAAQLILFNYLAHVHLNSRSSPLSVPSSPLKPRHKGTAVDLSGIYLSIYWDIGRFTCSKKAELNGKLHFLTLCLASTH